MKNSEVYQIWYDDHVKAIETGTAEETVPPATGTEEDKEERETDEEDDFNWSPEEEEKKGQKKMLDFVFTT